MQTIGAIPKFSEKQVSQRSEDLVEENKSHENLRNVSPRDYRDELQKYVLKNQMLEKSAKQRNTIGGTLHNSMMEKRDFHQERSPFQMGLSHGTIEEEKHQRAELSRSRELEEYLSRQRDSSAEKV